MSASEAKRPTHPGTDIAIIDGAEPGPGGGKIIIENDRVRVWSIALGPGERSALHTHLLDHILVQVEGDEICIEPHPETQGRYNEGFVAKVRPGGTAFIEKGGTETAVNIGTKRWREIVIELK